MTRLTHPQVLTWARAHAEAGRLPEARRLAALVLARAPADAAALRLAAEFGEGPSAPLPAAMIAAGDAALLPCEDGVLGTVVVPAYNNATTLGRALDSVQAAIDWVRTEDDSGARIRIVVAEDRSTDATLEVALAWARTHADTVVLHARVNGGAGTARNQGAAAAIGPYLWFLDADDAFLAPHLAVTLALFRTCPQAGWVKTGVAFDTWLHPSWYEVVENTTVFSMAIRRDAHAFVRGFPGDEPFRLAGGEDAAYVRALGDSFIAAKSPLPTVHHILRPGNTLDRMLPRFRRPLAESLTDFEDSPLQRDLLPIRQRIIAARRMALAELRRQPFAGPPFRAAEDPETIYVDVLAWS